ncbi:hypothetical protein BBP40_011368 [Aspergillus hancockii]|nr:hypothetical protein BBP40_011368 [Aspergillus hancockii]
MLVQPIRSFSGILPTITLLYPLFNNPSNDPAPTGLTVHHHFSGTWQFAPGRLPQLTQHTKQTLFYPFIVKSQSLRAVKTMMPKQSPRREDQTSRFSQTRFYESIVCYRYYERHDPSRIGPRGDVPEKWCKVALVKGEVAFARGYEALFTSIPSIALAIPYGLLADRWGGKPVVLLSIIGIFSSMTSTLVVCGLWQLFPLRLVWLSPVFTFIGGGAPVMFSMILAMIADLMPENERETAFFQLMTGQYLAQVTATPISSSLMDSDGPWLPIKLGYICVFMAFLIACLLKETANPCDPCDRNVPTEESITATDEASCLREMLGSKFRTELQVKVASFISVKLIATIITFMVILPGASWLLQRKLGLSNTRKGHDPRTWEHCRPLRGFLRGGMVPNRCQRDRGLCRLELGSELRGYRPLSRRIVGATAVYRTHGDVRWLGLPFIVAGVMGALVAVVI